MRRLRRHVIQGEGAQQISARSRYHVAELHVRECRYIEEVGVERPALRRKQTSGTSLGEINPNKSLPSLGRTVQTRSSCRPKGL